MITKDTANRFANDWIAAWNSHDIDRILSHYSGDFEMTSPFIAKVMSVSSGTLRGKSKVADYWRTAIKQFPDLRFELIDVLWSVETICIVYVSVRNLRATELLWLDENERVTKAIAHYNAD